MRRYLIFGVVVAWTAAVVISWFTWIDTDDPWGLDETIAWGLYLAGLVGIAILWGVVELAIYAWRSLADRRAGRVGLALVPVGLAILVAWLALRGSDEEPVLVRGEARADIRGGLFEVTPPYFVAVYRGYPNTPGAGTDPVAEGDTDADGRFVLRSDMSEDEARDLYVYVTAYGYEPACGYVQLPPLRRGDDAYVDARTGARIDVEVTLREPRRSGVWCD